MDWIETASGNRISRTARIEGSDHILIAGNSTISAGVELLGQVRLQEGKTAIQLGRFCYISENVIITPPAVSPGVHKPSKLGSYTMIGAESTINSSHIGNRVLVGANCHLHNLSVIHDCVIIEPNTVIPEQATIPPFSLVSNDRIEQLPESYKKLLELHSKLSYVNSQFIPSETP